MNLDELKFERIQEGLETITVTNNQLIALNEFKRIHTCDKFYNAMSVVANYVGNRNPIWINRNSQVFKERNISYRQVTKCINWLESNGFIIKVRLANRFTKQCAHYISMTPGFFKWFRSYLESRSFFEYLFKDNYEPFLSTYYGYIDMPFMQSIQQYLNRTILSSRNETYPLINFTIREKDQDFMLLYGNGSGRAYSDYANEIKEENIECYEDISRQKILAEKWGCKIADIVEYDVKSSVPRISRLMNYGIWESQDLDFYEILFKKFFESKGLKWNKDLRNDCKMLFMFLAFNLEISKEKRLNNINWRLKYDKENKIPYLRNNFNKFSKEDISELLKNIDNFCGKIPNNIFIIESSIYLCFLYVLKQRGYFPENKIEFVFDAIETCEKIDKKEFDDILEKVAYTFKNKFINRHFKPIYTLDNIIDNLDYEKYNLMWQTTDNHFSKVFGNPKKLNDETVKILDKLYHFNGGLTKLYFKKGIEACKRKLELAREKVVTLQENHSDLQSLGLDKQSLKQDKQSLKKDKQSLKQDKQSLGLDLQSLGLDLQSLGLDLQSLKLDKQSLERKERDESILKQIKELLSQNPSIKMKEIEKKLNISNKYRIKLM